MATAPGVRHQPVLPEETSNAAVRARRTDTLSLYRQAGLTPPARVQRLIAGSSNSDQDVTSDAPAVTASAYTNSAGQVIPPGLRDHVDPYCSGTGTDGSRVQVMYLRESDQPDRYTQVAPILRNEARYIDDAFAVSSAETGGGKRVRWVTDASCALSVLNVVLPDGAISGNHGTTENALQQAGYLQANRKYLAFADVPMGGLGGMACGQGAIYNDTKPTDNLNDGRYPQLARIDLECWVTDDRYNAAPLHELLHTLGAVMPEAPHGSPGFHCTDASEVMCYNDGTATVQQVCPETQQYDIDCNNDDYFSTNPAPGSYLATHWNTANSPFLASVPRLPTPPTITVTSSTASPSAGDKVTFTANVPAGTRVDWSSDAPWCENTGAATTGLTYAIQCFGEGAVTVTAAASAPGQVAVGYAPAVVTYGPGTAQHLSVDSPTTAAVNTPFTLTANMANTTSAWTYEWTLRTPGCTSDNVTTNATLSVTCDSTTQGKLAEFTVAATRTADGAVEATTVAVQINAAGSGAVTVDGPTTVRAGQSATFTAIVSNVTSPTYQWSSLNWWGVGTNSGASFTVQVPTGTPATTDRLTLTVRSATGERTEVTVVYDVEPALTMTMTGPSKVTAGATVTYTVRPNKPATIGWSDDQDACTTTPDPADPTVGRLTCDASYAGTVRVSAVATAGDETTSRTRAVAVSAAATSSHDTRLTFTASRGYPTKMTVTLTDAKTGETLPGRLVQLERRDGATPYQKVSDVLLGDNGSATFSMTVTDAAYYRVAFLGEQGFAESVSAERHVAVFTRLSNAKTGTGIRATLQTGWGEPLANTRITLQMKAVGSSKWVQVKTCRTNSKGVAIVKVNPTKSTDFRWAFNGSSSFTASTSKSVRLT